MVVLLLQGPHRMWKVCRGGVVVLLQGPHRMWGVGRGGVVVLLLLLQGPHRMWGVGGRRDVARLLPMKLLLLLEPRGGGKEAPAVGGAGLLLRVVCLGKRRRGGVVGLALAAHCPLCLQLNELLLLITAQYE